MINYASQPRCEYSAGDFQTGGSFFIKSALSPDNHYLISGSRNGCAFLWNVNDHQTNDSYLKIAGHSSEVTSVSWGREGHHLALGCEDGHLNVWHSDWYGNVAEQENFDCADLVSVESQRKAKVKPKGSTITTFTQSNEIDLLDDLPPHWSERQSIYQLTTPLTVSQRSFFTSIRIPLTPLSLNDDLVKPSSNLKASLEQKKIIQPNRTLDMYFSRRSSSSEQKRPKRSVE